MSSRDTEFQIYDLAADLLPEICGYLEVHDQVTMKRICQWWRSNLPETGLSGLVAVDGSRMLNQSEILLKHALTTHVQKNTKILVLRHMAFEAGPMKFGSILRTLERKKAELILLILQDCTVETEYAGIGCLWLDPQKIPRYTLQRLLFATKKLILVNYTIWNALSGPVLSFMDPMMPCSVPTSDRRFAKQDLPLPVVLPRHEFDCTKPFSEHYHGFIMALNLNCPEVSPEIRDAVVQLYNSWIHSDAEEDQWQQLGYLIKSFNKGVPVRPYRDGLHMDIQALRQLDPLTLNKLTMEALYRLYF